MNWHPSWQIPLRVGAVRQKGKIPVKRLQLPSRKPQIFLCFNPTGCHCPESPVYMTGCQMHANLFTIGTETNEEVRSKLLKQNQTKKHWPSQGGWSTWVTRPKKLASQISPANLRKERTLNTSNFHQNPQTEIRDTDKVRKLTSWQDFVRNHRIFCCSSSQ